MMGYFMNNAGGQWAGGATDAYIGLAFDIGGSKHYGWARVDLTADAPEALTIKDFAYNISPGDPIKAGDTMICSSAGIDANLALCSGAGTFNMIDSLGANVDPNGLWQPSFTSGTNVFDPLQDIASSYQYQLTGAGTCIDDTSFVSITITPGPSAGNNGLLDICSSATPIDLYNSLGGTADLTGVWSPILASGSGTFNPAVDLAGTYTYDVAASGNCGSSSATVIVTIGTPVDAGQDTAVFICSGAPSFNMVDSLAGSPSLTGTWSPAVQTGVGIFDPSVDTDVLYTYTVIGNGGCPADSAVLNISFLPSANAGTNSAMNLCSSGTSINLFDSLGGSPDATGSWSPVLGGGYLGTFDPATDASGTYVYFVPSTGGCPSASSSTVINLLASADAGTNGTAALTPSSGTVDLLDSLGGSPNTGGTWSPALASGTGSFDPVVDTAGVYTYTSSAAGCPDASATVTVSISGVTVISQRANSSENVRIYPNPSSGEITISFNEFPEENRTISIFNSLGQQVQRNTTCFNSNKVVISSLPSGYYSVIIKSDKLNRHIPLIVK
jgi:hypothetical protein